MPTIEKLIFANGKSQTLKEWSRETGISISALRKRIRLGWPNDKVVSTPPAKRVIHSKSDSPEYKSWCALIYRCKNPKQTGFPRYGGRGIKVCARWLPPASIGFVNFLKDMGPRGLGTSIDRIDNDGDYEPSNCRWATNNQQSANRSTNRKITFNGETLCMFEWAKKLGCSRAVLHWRLSAGWSDYDTISVPIRRS